ncbi:MAG: DUF1501 domain-containing protein [Acidobacteria bacterium]|nr:MAG: DUF1501 domain-containing protein [Acidobacteriota bacterium]REK10704.1 MAG: DUF1501 domain-containing protein [Acidobacteriota bacterium]
MKLHRRAFLKGSAVSVLGLGLSGSGPLFLRRAAWAAPGTARRRPVLVAVFQRGAMDGLMAVPPLERELRGPLSRLRPSLALSAARAAGEEQVIDLGVGFGLHPALAGLQPLWRDGHLAVVHAVGSPDPTRSHFDAQDYMETATPGVKSTRTGWLDRVVGELGHEAPGAPDGGASQAPSPLRAVAMTDVLPRSLQGPSGGVAISELGEFRLHGDVAASRRTGRGPRPRGRTTSRDETSEATRSAFEALYSDPAAGDLARTGVETFEAMEALDAHASAVYRPAAGVRYPESPLGGALRQVAQLIKADVGLEVAFTESGGWDTHVQQGTIAGSFARRARDLGDSIAAFWRDLGALRSDVVLLTMTEFGRTVAENGSAGTDHGRASCMFALGEKVRGGRVHGAWPGLEHEQLDEGRDLAVATDFRSVFGELAVGHLGVGESELAGIFPGFGGSRLPLLRG